MPSFVSRRLSLATAVLVLSHFSARTICAQERAPAASPSWRLMVDAGRTWGLGGGTPSGRGTSAALAGRRRLSTHSPVAFELGLMLGAYERPRSAQEPSHPFGEATRDTTRRLALIGTYAATSVDLHESRRGSIFAESGVYFGSVRDRTRFDKATTIERQVGERLGLFGGVGVRLLSGFGLKARYLWVSVPSRPIHQAEVLTSVTLF